MFDALYILQFGCLVTTVIMALILLFSKAYVKYPCHPYKHSHNILTATAFILSMHFLMQMSFDLRASGDDVGATINILFYAPVLFLVSYSVLNLECGAELRRHYLKVGIIGYVLILAAFFIGYVSSGSLHIGVALHVMDLLFIACMLYFIIIPTREIRRTYRRIESFTGGDLHSYVTYIRNGYYLLCISAFTLPFSIVSTKSLYIVGPLLFFVFLKFIVSFIALGFDSAILQTMHGEHSQHISETDVETITPNAVETADLDNRDREISDKLDKWVESRGYCERDVTLISLSMSITVNRRELSDYLDRQYHKTFRTWLSDIRLQAAKDLMREHPEYSNEAISSACGFSSRAQLYNIFRDREGMTPKEYQMSQSGQTTE